MTYAYRLSGLATGLTRVGLETAGHHASRFRDPTGLELPRAGLSLPATLGPATVTRLTARPDAYLLKN
jgi:hypothetical protein